MSLQDRLDAFRKNFEAAGPPCNAPEWIHEPMHRATAELIASGAAERAAKVGDKAPAFSLEDAEGNEVSSIELLPQGPLVVTFYRGVWSGAPTATWISRRCRRRCRCSRNRAASWWRFRRRRQRIAAARCARTS
jgi:AhpC/TSA family